MRATGRRNAGGGSTNPQESNRGSTSPQGRMRWKQQRNRV
jgi:hypothetical protein